MRAVLILIVLAALSFTFAGCGDDDTPGSPDGALAGVDAAAGNDAGLLAPPPAEEGFQVVLDPVEVPAGEEVYWCYALPFPVDGEFDVSRLESHFTQGAHHLLVSTVDASYPAGAGACGAGDFGFGVSLIEGFQHNLRFLSGAQTPYADDPRAELALEPGMAFRVRAGSTLLLQLHWFNASDAPQTGRTVINFWYPTTPPTRLLEAFFFYASGFSLPPHATTEVAGRCTFPADAEVVGMVSHMHARGLGLTTRLVRGGVVDEMVYSEDSWQDPQMKMWPAAELLGVPAGDGFEYRCTFDNPTDATIVEGEHAGNEMCMLIGLYAGGDRTLFGFPGQAFPGNPCVSVP